MSSYHEAMEALEFNKAIDEVWLMIRSLNQYIENVKPWEIAKSREKDPEAEEHLSEVLAYAVGALLQIGDLLVPFLPATAARIHSTFESGVIVLSESVLFPKIYIHTLDPKAPKVQ
jgi:methionyl-tRNA synthetase